MLESVAKGANAIQRLLFAVGEGVCSIPYNAGVLAARFFKDCHRFRRGGEISVSFQPDAHTDGNGFLSQLSNAFGNPVSCGGPVGTGLNLIAENANPRCS